MSDKSSFWAYFGQGIALFLICIGISGCDVLLSYSDKLDAEAKVIKASIK